MALGDYLHLQDTAYPWDPSAFTPMCRAFMNADRQEVYNFVADVMVMNYDEFLNTIYWGIVKGYVLSTHPICTCGSQFGLQVHHKTYAHHGEEHRYLDDLQVKCRLCHKEIHGLATVEDMMKIEKNRQKAGQFRQSKPNAGGDVEHVSVTAVPLIKRMPLPGKGGKTAK